ncbi:MAG: AAA family ATPase [Prolixibacteraceae bacterium]|nr:AAA family ATPase [Prolixibacteraceae bacterium]
MITKINSIKNFRIFQNYFHNANLKDYNRYNLFYGWNGSGKSTLASLFECLERKEQSQEYFLSEWSIEADNIQITHNNVNDNNLNIKTFNKSFVEKNVFTPNDKIKGIIYISEGQGKDKEELDEKTKELNKKVHRKKEIEIELNGNPDDKKAKGFTVLTDKFLSDAAKSIKANFKVIEIEDTRLLNYDKTKLSNFITQNADSIKTKKSTLSVPEIERLSKSIRPQDKTKIDVNSIQKYDPEILLKIFERVKELCNSKITTKAIERLKENPAIAQWVYQGLQENIHGQDATICEFCAQPLPEYRIADLNKHFSDEFEKLKEALSKGIEWIESNKIRTEFPFETLLYDEFQNDYKQSLSNYDKIINLLNTKLEEWKFALSIKENNPFEIPQNAINEISIAEIDIYTIAFNKVMQYIESHNKKFDGLEDVVKANKQKLELHYVSEEVAKFGYFDKLEQISKLQEEQSKINKEATAFENDVKILKDKLSNETLGLSEFNDKLWNFLGRNDLSLERRTEGGYLVKRNNTEEAKSRSLSEGERTAIALVYFITKLKENGNKIEDTIVVIDDPISSFDSNHLFHANFFIKNECKNALQLFVFTHSFHFFTLEKEWIKLEKEEKTENGKVKKYDLHSIYQIKPTIKNDVRNGNIENADNILDYFDSEYHLLFSEVKKFCDNPQTDYITTHTIANICRQLLESFLTFKFGRTKLEKCFDEINDFENLSKIRKFVNHFSHKTDNGASMTGFNDNIFGEADKIVPDVLKLVEHIDKVHYDSMIARLNNA